MAIQFGGKQLKQPTPTSVGNIIQVFTIIAACVLAWIGTATFIPANTSTVLQSILGLLIGIANGIKPFFGVKTTGETVDVENVSQMDEPTFTKPAAPNDSKIQNK